MCKKSFLILNLLRDHVEKGVCKLENRTCEICSKVLTDKARKDIHMRIHNKERSYSCTICEKSFIQKRSLKEHSLTHDTVRHFECSLCNKKFVQSNHLKYHISSHHPSAFPELAKHKCDLCSKVFPFSYQLKRHQRIHGSGNGSGAKSSLQCGSCLNWLPSPTLLRAHADQCYEAAAAADRIADTDILVSVEEVDSLEGEINIDSYTT